MAKKEKFESLVFAYPEIAAMWHPTQNGKMVPLLVDKNSQDRYFWTCNEGHVWDETVINMIKSVQNGERVCPYCTGKLPIPGKTDLVTTHPHIAAMWHPTKNEGLKPEDVTIKSRKYIFWRCARCGSDIGSGLLSYTPESMLQRYPGERCSCCVDVPDGVNFDSLAFSSYGAAEMWHPTKNGNLTPNDVLKSSRRKLWWKCDKCGHEWNETYAAFASHRSIRCPECRNQALQDREKRMKQMQYDRSLAAKEPDLAKQWHPTKNGDLTPDKHNAESSTKVWWQCEHGHEWQASAKLRAKKKECPYCMESVPTGWLVLGRNDLATVYPDLAAMWHPVKNGPLEPKDVLPSKNRRPWWFCPKCGFQWQKSIGSMIDHSECPNCSKEKSGTAGKKGHKSSLESGVNDLATMHPDVAAEWHPTLNGGLTPNMVTCGINRKVWWKCSNPECEHEWAANISSRTLNHSGCPKCARRMAAETRRMRSGNR